MSEQRHFAPGVLTGGELPARYGRYSDRPTDWRTRIAGMGGTAGIFLLVLACLFLTWRAVRPIVAPSVPLAVNLLPQAAPPEPVEEVPEGPRQVEQQEQKPQEERDRPDLPDITIPQLSPPTQPVLPPVEQARAADPVPETTAPKSVPAPPGSRVSNDTDATWEALLLAHLEKYRRYPADSRARRERGVAYVRFTMNRQGKVLSSQILRSSGYAALDRAALETIRKAQPLPPVPVDRPDPLELTMPVEFFVRR